MTETQDNKIVKDRKTILFTGDNRERIEARWIEEKSKVEQHNRPGVSISLNKLLNDLLDIALSIEAESRKTTQS